MHALSVALLGDDYFEAEHPEPDWDGPEPEPWEPEPDPCPDDHRDIAVVSTHTGPGGREIEHHQCQTCGWTVQTHPTTIHLTEGDPA